MANDKRKNRFLRRLLSKFKFKYKLVFLDEQTYEEVFMLRLSKMNVFTYFGSAAMLIIVLVTLLIAFTPIREYIPGYPTGAERRMIIRNAQRVDSLVMEIEKRDRILGDIRTIMTGEPIEGAQRKQEVKQEESKSLNVTFKRSAEDSLFRKKIEEEERFNLGIQRTTSQSTQIEQFYLFPPVKGMVVNKFGDSYGHFGVDIAAAEGTRVSAVTDGTVIFTGWTVETGYVIQIQHPNNLTSIYKHNQKLLKAQGASVKAAEAIATVGNSGELTTGPHLHFELWYKGAPVNPEDYVSFK
jgi:murein DD-endopeptidase MepM/ murein hydrolase activator NlpD